MAESEFEAEFHLTDDDLPPEALKDCFHPPRESTLVHCIHCGEEYDSWRMVYRVRVAHDGKVRGFWDCGIPGCDGAGFMFDIYPVDPNYVAEDGAIQGEWVEDHEDDCECEECVAFRVEMEEWERDHPMPTPAPSSGPPAEPAPLSENETDRRRIEAALAGMGPQRTIPLDDLLPADGDDDDESGGGVGGGAGAGVGGGVLTHATMEQIEERLGLRSSGGAASSSAEPPRPAPQPLPPNWRELLTLHDQERSAPPEGGAVDDIPF